MNETERLTYARAKLMDLLEKRGLKAWCQKNNLPHATMYKLAVGSSIPTFKMISELLPFFAPAEWVYFTDERIPYEFHTLPAWNPDEYSEFLFCHKQDWRDIAQKYGFTLENARNICVNRRANVTLLQLRKMAKDVNPEEFFTPPENGNTGLFFPNRGDIVTFGGKQMLVLSGFKENKKHSFFIGVENTEPVDITTLAACPYVRKAPVVVDKADAEAVESVLDTVRKVLILL